MVLSFFLPFSMCVVLGQFSDNFMSYLEKVNNQEIENREMLLGLLYLIFQMNYFWEEMEEKFI